MEKVIVLVVAFKDFRDEEYFIPKEYFEKEGFQVRTASNKKGFAVGVYGGEALVDLEIKDLDPSKIDVLVLVGGPGALRYLDNEESYKIVKNCFLEKKILGAICIAPVVFAKAGILKEKKATVWSSEMEKSAIRFLKKEGALYTPEEVVCDERVITAKGPQEAEEFAKKVTERVKNFS